jgi:CRISPR-associated endonuclease/helicase Cas3
MKFTEYFAHSENESGEKHILKKHLCKTADIASSFSDNNEYKKVFRLAGLLHDFGKYQPEFQRYLVEGGKRGSVPHAALGAGFARILRQLEISLVIDGHHKGLPDPSKWKNDTQEFFCKQNTDFSNIMATFLKDTGLDDKEQETNLRKFAPLERELFIRYLFSALTDADWLDTEAHFKPEHTETRCYKELPVDTMIEKLDAAIAQKAKDGEINNLRNQVRVEVLGKSKSAPGFYSLNLPTGMGKTLVSVAWALRHAKANSLKRIIIVLPFINIIDQTAKILKELFGEELILEHHSGFNEELLSDEMAIDSEEKKKRLACENWEFPVIVTTTVQFFESLFSNKSSKCRKVHNIAKSVVIFDEVQTLPKEIILPTLTILENVQKLMNSSFLFCTATMPAFEKREGFDGIEKIHPLVENPECIYNKTRRVDYLFLQNLQPVNLTILAKEIQNNNCSVLCIFNTKKAAKELYEQVITKSFIWDHTYHLSTGMCPIHRKMVIKEIIRDLDAKRKIFVASTQLIEAGVDFDFPCVFREIAPLESIIQSAGRCNREDKMPENGRVFLFKLLEGGMPDKVYKTYAEFTIDLIKDDLDQLYKYDFFKGYYRKIINLFSNPDKFNINEARRKLEFETVSDSYHLIGKPTESLFIYQYNDDSNKLLNDLKGKPFLSRDDYRRMQVYTVQVYKNFLIKNAHLCSTTSLGFLIWNGTYDKGTGISTQLMSPDECIV